jgi:hypothetical protein
MNLRKDIVRRAANIRVDSRSSFVDSPLEAPFDKLTAMSLPNGSARLCYELCIISGTVFFRLRKKETPAGHPYICSYKYCHLFIAFAIYQAIYG